ncbi:L,D-transpeptidase family protein [Simiduia sp. 21SJ11W-1]|uniref:L,D-transpeptidase family protein n=1 Tax=Simiduia sp. 21SJ11W-1 TaxID=2909669 RepID=UPI00209DC045|nr:L,D-transpeptidase family protein [Simiduia sp. 21SJ11W-1]UTA47866.1 L,D-transpeptidase family protein [Simiduia sp. 21SJ11W-1]
MSARRFFCALLLTVWLQPAQAYAEDALQQRLDAWQAGFSASAAGLHLHHADALQAFYQSQGFTWLWFDSQGKLRPRAHELMNAIANTAAEGLMPEDYRHGMLARIAGQASLERAEQVDLELLMSDSFITLASHLRYGKVDPGILQEQWRNVQANELLPDLLTPLLSESVTNVLASHRPNQPRYGRLMSALGAMRALSERPWPAFSLRPSVKFNGADPRLPEIAERLMLLGDLPEAWAGEVLDAPMADAVRNFQRRHGLQQDGDIGPETFAALNITPAERAGQIVANLERWRWLDTDLGERFLLVNIAGFDLRLIENDERVMQQAVIVGRDYRKTPVFSDKVRYLVFNPTWTVPAKLAIHDKLPEIQKNPDYLREYGFTVYRGGSSEVVDPATVDWAKVNKSNFNFRLVQSPGPLNALGQVKFMFPNSHAVYLHDTPARELFDKHQRAFSSGCIRVADPMLLAELLLRDEGYTRADIDAWVASGETKTVYLKSPMPVHLEYWTAWVNSTNTLHFRADIYKRDRPLLAALNAPI